MENGWVRGPQKATELHAVRFLLSGVGRIESVFSLATPADDSVMCNTISAVIDIKVLVFVCITSVALQDGSFQLQ